ncbi:hypothetical protein R5R35_006394 [Gryllus longicercus]|uniref:protein-tyrosine-phosphatase n=1 Tax=Gryllus longicercus TaxID=2509291 RepID=A0AAN9W1X6_9ORTH
MKRELFAHLRNNYGNACIAVGLFYLLVVKASWAADLAIQIPAGGGGAFRLDYQPPVGEPAPNSTVSGGEIRFSRALPGTRYEFWLYFSNSSVSELLTWTASITTAPDPPTNLTVTPQGGKQALVSWRPPARGHASSYKIKVIPLSESLPPEAQRAVTLHETGLQYTLQNLTPGASYQLQLLTVYDDKESLAYTSRNFTTKPNTPGKFIVWFRNETTLLVLWQPPYPVGVFSDYKVSIQPPDAPDSVLYVSKDTEPPGPAQAAFKGLVPGRAYDISVQTETDNAEVSTPTTAQYRTVPLRPLNVTYDPASVSESSFRVHWEPPRGNSEFDKYQVMLSLRRPTPVTLGRDEPTTVEFREGLEAGRSYQVVVKTVSGKVTSWPATVNVTLKPLPVRNLQASMDEGSGLVSVSWAPDNSSHQESYKLTYHEVDSSFNGDSNVLKEIHPPIRLESLLPGRNYSISVVAVSGGVESNETLVYQATRPFSPIIGTITPIERGLNISWKSDVKTRQEKFEVVYKRNDTDEAVSTLTIESSLILRDLYPGAGYEVKVFALSHGLRSEPHAHFQAVYPHPPQNVTIEKVTSNSVVVRWLPPTDSLYQEFIVKSRPESEDTWVPFDPSTRFEAEVIDMVPGEKYHIQVITASFGVESIHPQEVTHTIRPNPVSNIAPLVDSTNVTLEWPRPEGRVERYIVRWQAVDDPEFVQVRNVTEQMVNPRSEHNTEEGRPVRVLIGDLTPGLNYTFRIHTESYGLQSDNTVLYERTMPLIQSEVVVVNNPQLTDEVTLRYTPTPPASSRFDRYRFQLSDPNVQIKEKPSNDTDMKVTFKGLVPGRLYNITLWTVSGNRLSQPLQRQDRLYPESVSHINATIITDTMITLVWDPPTGDYTEFEVSYLNAEQALVNNVTRHNSITITELRPHWNYTFTVTVRSGTESSILRKSLPISKTFSTHESVPGKVEHFHPEDIQPSDITFSWMLPSNEQNGVILKFSITYGLEGSTLTEVRDFGSQELGGTIRNLIPGKTYLFRIQAETRVGYGPEAVWKQKMPILAPPIPGPRVVPSEVSVTSKTIQIRYRKNYFSDKNGAVISYTVIVAEDNSKNASGLEMPSWRDVQAYSVWPPYQVMEPYFPFVNATVEDFIVGRDSCDVRSLGYCNGPLKPGTTYRVKVRAFTAPDKFTDTAYSFPIQTDADNTHIILGVGVPVVIVLLLAITIFILKRRRTVGRRAAETRGNDSLSLPDSIIETSRPIRLDKFAEHYRIMSADSDFRFSEEFEELKHVGREQPCTAADLPCNRPKNRFTNILPYDHSRFKLQPVDDEEGSDYINANYVPGHNSPREFLVTQGPLHSTRDDFWRMCWESNSRAIVMLTRCVEKGREKCDHYWPYDTLPVYYGDICVTTLNDSHYPDWNVTEFMMCRGDQTRIIRHFHFTTWPDFGVPSPPQTLVRFVRAFRERVGPDQKPIVVHCSAGVGRSGTFIALDSILQQITIQDHVDIFGIVWAMRKERVWMVQTEQQYICIHQCLLAVLEGSENQGPPREVHDNQGFEGKNSRSAGPECGLSAIEKQR